MLENKIITYSAITLSESQTKHLGFNLCETLLNRYVNLDKKIYIIIEGRIGSGKTILTKGIAQKLGIREDEVTSPTFLLLKTYKNDIKNLHHLDLYRILDNKNEEKNCLIEIEELLENTYKGDIIVIETNINIMHFLDEWDYYIQIKVLDNKNRNIIVKQNI